MYRGCRTGRADHHDRGSQGRQLFFAVGYKNFTKILRNSLTGSQIYVNLNNALLWRSAVIIVPFFGKTAK